MKEQAPSPQQWQLLHRLQAAGCPVDLAHVPPPDHPLRVICTAKARTNVLPVRDGIGIILPLRIVAAVAITITGFRLDADWLSAPVAWVEPCAEHRGKYCLTDTAKRHLSLAKVLNQRTLYSGRLKRGEFLQGCLVGTTKHPLRSDVELPATLYIQDLAGIEYPYLQVLRNTPLEGVA